MKICPVCQETNHDAADACMLCGALLPTLPSVDQDAEDGGELLLPTAPEQPPSGSLALAVYHDKDPRVVAWFALDGDVALIGREDAEQGNFPEIDVARLTDKGVSAAHVSRRHARLLRYGPQIILEVLPETTGTQVNKRIVQDGHSATVDPGDRIILGGRVRMKLVQL